MELSSNERAMDKPQIYGNKGTTIAHVHPVKMVQQPIMSILNLISLQLPGEKTENAVVSSITSYKLALSVHNTYPC